MNEICLTCGVTITDFGHNPHPINDDPSLVDRRVCGDCNGMYVIPARLGHEVSGNLFDTDGRPLGTFEMVKVPA